MTLWSCCQLLTPTPSRGSHHENIRHRRIRLDRLGSCAGATQRRPPSGWPRPVQRLRTEAERGRRHRSSRGIDEPAGLAEAAANSDAVIHLAFQHDVGWSGNFADATAADRRAMEAMGAALANSDRPFVLASGMLGMKVGQIVTEDDGLVPGAAVRASPADRRSATTLFTLSLAGIGVRSSVLRFPPTVHGEGDHGFVATFVAIARQTGVSVYVGDGMNRWPAVHVADAARLTRLAVEEAPAGSVLHAVSDEGVPFCHIAQAIGSHKGCLAASLARHVEVVERSKALQAETTRAQNVRMVTTDHGKEMFFEQILGADVARCIAVGIDGQVDVATPYGGDVVGRLELAPR